MNELFDNFVKSLVSKTARGFFKSN